MKSLKRFLGVALAALLALPVAADISTEAGRATLISGFDVPAAGYTYGAFSQNLATWVGVLSTSGIPVPKRVTTVGSSTTITAVTVGSAPFLTPNVADMLILVPPQGVNTPAAVAGIRTERIILTNADNDTVTVGTAIDLTTTGVTFSWKRFLSGTGAEDAWFPIANFKRFTIVYEVIAFSATSLDSTLECRVEPGSAGTQVGTLNFTAAGSKHLAVETPFTACRVGWKHNTDTGVNSVATYIEYQR